MSGCFSDPYLSVSCILCHCGCLLYEILILHPPLKKKKKKLTTDLGQTAPGEREGPEVLEQLEGRVGAMSSGREREEYGKLQGVAGTPYD